MNFRYMKIDFILFIMSYLIILLIFSITTYNFFISDFIKLENKQNQNNINTILSEINTKIENIKNITNDYSKWDDSYYFIKNATPDYIYENFREGTTTLEDLDIDFILYSKTEGKTVFSKYSNDFPPINKIDFEKEISKNFKKNTANTIFKYKGNFLYLIKSEIKKSDGRGNSNGYIYSGKIISNKSLNSLSKVFKKIYKSEKNFNKNHLEPKLPYLKNIKVNVSYRNSTLINTIQIYDIYNNYMFSITTENERDIINNGEKTIFLFNLIVAIFLFLFLFIIYKNQAVLERLVESKSKELIEKQKIIAHQSKMAAMGEIIENISHQWRQPLSVISTASSGIKFNKEMGLLSDELLLDSVDNITNSAQYLSSTINDFRNFFSKNKKSVLFDLPITVEKAIGLINPIFTDKKIKIIQNIQDIQIYGIDNELMQVFLNIFNNSIDAFEEEKFNYEKLIIIDIYKEDEKVVINIKDNAGGIPKNIIERIFEPYFTTKHQSQGTGIGLYMSFEIITNHMGGELFVKNSSFTLDMKKYEGAEFTIKFPIVQ